MLKPVSLSVFPLWFFQNSPACWFGKHCPISGWESCGTSWDLSPNYGTLSLQCVSPRANLGCETRSLTKMSAFVVAFHIHNKVLLERLMLFLNHLFYIVRDISAGLFTLFTLWLLPGLMKTCWFSFPCFVCPCLPSVTASDLILHLLHLTEHHSHSLRFSWPTGCSRSSGLPRQWLRTDC